MSYYKRGPYNKDDRITRKGPTEKHDPSTREDPTARGDISTRNPERVLLKERVLLHTGSYYKRSA